MSLAFLLLLSVLVLAASSVSAVTIAEKYGASPFTGFAVDKATGNTFAISGSTIVCNDAAGNFLLAFELPYSLSAAPAAIAMSRTTSILYVTDSITPQRIITLSINGTAKWLTGVSANSAMPYLPATTLSSPSPRPWPSRVRRARTALWP
jgi:hypothetical protein